VSCRCEAPASAVETIPSPYACHSVGFCITPEVLWMRPSGPLHETLEPLAKTRRLLHETPESFA
jgi:hypothetical protein